MKFNIDLHAILDLLRTIAVALVIAFVIRTFFFQPFHIPSPSMEPGLKSGDYIIVTKFSYGYSKYSATLGWFYLDFLPDRIWGEDPERGDVIVFRKPNNNWQDFIKRVVALPGDTVEMRNGILHINGEAADREVHVEPGNFQVLIKQYQETFPDGHKHIIQVNEARRSTAENCVNIPRFGGRCTSRMLTVPDDHFFVMGDNRNNSEDSRFQGVGLVPRENLIGEAQIIVFSWRNFFGRLFKVIR